MFVTIGQSKLLKRVILYTVLIDVVCVTVAVCLYSFLIWPQLKKASLTQTQNTVDALADEIDVYISDLVDYSRIVAQSSDLSALFAAYNDSGSAADYEKIRQLLYSKCSMLVNLRGVIVVDEDTNKSFDSINNISDPDWMFVNDVLASDTVGECYAPVYNMDYNDTVYTTGFSFTKTINGHTYRFFFFYKMNFIISNMKNLVGDCTDEYVLAMTTGEILYSSEDADITISFAEDQMADFKLSYADYAAGYMFSEYTNNYTWQLACYTSNTTLIVDIVSTFLLILCIFLVFSVVIVGLVLGVIAHAIVPLNELNSTMQLVTKGSLDEHVEFHTKDEIEEMGNIFNHMLVSIKEHIDSRIAYENREQRMKYNLLIAQIDSHFICNTMNVINSLARRKMYTEIISANTALTKIINNSLRVKTYDITDTIEQELDVLRQYFYIEKLRYRNTVELIIDVPDYLLEYEIPKNILQPIVENSLLHGLMNLETGIIEGMVVVAITKEEDMLKICIMDNGIGLPAEKIALLNDMKEYMDTTVERGKHIGLVNIYERLDYIYGDKASMIFAGGENFSVTIRIPFPEDAE